MYLSENMGFNNLLSDNLFIISLIVLNIAIVSIESFRSKLTVTLTQEKKSPNNRLSRNSRLNLLIVLTVPLELVIMHSV